MTDATPAQRFIALHRRQPGLILPNAWDAGSARLLELGGFEAIATTSAGIAFAAGRRDGSLGFDEMLAAVAPVVDAVGVPVSVDLESGYGDTPEDVTRSVAAAVELGAVGANLEDAVAGALFPLEIAAERIAAARSAAPPGTFFLNARIDTYLLGADDPAVLATTIERGHRYVAAGADGIFVPGVDDLATIRTLAHELPAPLNIVSGLTAQVHDAASLFDAGVARISIGGSLARAALGVVRAAADEMLHAGTFTFTDGALPHAALQRDFFAARLRLIATDHYGPTEIQAPSARSAGRTIPYAATK